MLTAQRRLGLLLLGTLALSSYIAFAKYKNYEPFTITTAVIIFAFLSHIPAFLRISDATKVFGTGPTWLRPLEFVFIALIGVSWMLVIIAGAHTLTVAILALTTTTCVGLGYAAIRFQNLISQELELQTQPNPFSGLHEVKSTIGRYTYFFRVFCVGESLIAIIWISIGLNRATVGLVLLVMTSAIASILVTGVGAYLLRRQARSAQRMASTALGKVEKQHGAAEIILYCSDSARAKHVRIKSLTKSIAREGFVVAIVAREMRSVSKLKTFGAHYVWPVPYMTTIDSVARPYVRAVFYTHDGMKNGQFTRFSQYHHVIDATTGRLSRMEQLSQALDMYDYILAPSPAVAATWREGKPSQTAAKVLTLDLRKIAHGDSERSINAEAKVSICLTPPEFSHERISTKTKAGIRNLLERHRYQSENDLEKLEDIEPRLFFSFATKETDTIDPWLKRILADIDGHKFPLVSHHVGAAETTWNRADIIVVTDYNQAVALSTVGKPLLWLGDGPAPAGIPSFDLASNQPLQEMAGLPDPVASHFNSYHDLLDHMDNEREQ